MSLDELLAALAADSRRRLRWRVNRELGIVPGSRMDRRLSDLDCLVCGLNLLLDMEGFASGAENAAHCDNPAFDDALFRGLKTAGAESITSLEDKEL